MMKEGSGSARAMRTRTVFSALAGAFLFAEVIGGEVECPVPPHVSSYEPAQRTALASHPRAGSTWMRYLLEHATGLPCGAEKAAWANVLPHVGGEENPNFPNRDGVVTKTHSSCYGCWPGASKDQERFTITKNSSTFTKKQIAGHVGKPYVTELEENGACLFFPPASFDTHLDALSKMRGPGEAAKKKMMLGLDSIPCKFEYEKAIILIRDPLDTIKSNYHYRTAVLKMRPKNTWGKDDFWFPFERGESFVKFYHSWRRFAEFNPTITVRYEDLKSNTARELKRVTEFLELDVSDEMIECAIQASTVDKLKESPEVNPNMNVKADMFFGSRDQTMDKEELLYPEALLNRFEQVGLWEMNELYGYGGRPAPPPQPAGADKEDL